MICLPMQIIIQRCMHKGKANGFWAETDIPAL